MIDNFRSVGVYGCWCVGWVLHSNLNGPLSPVSPLTGTSTTFDPQDLFFAHVPGLKGWSAFWVCFLIAACSCITLTHSLDVQNTNVLVLPVYYGNVISMGRHRVDDIPTLIPSRKSQYIKQLNFLVVWFSL